MAKITDFLTRQPTTEEEVLQAQAQERSANRAERFKKLRGLLKRAVVALLSLVVLASAILAIVYRDQLNIDSLKRMVSYLNMERDESGQTEEIYYDVDDTNCYAQLNNALLVCSSTSIQLYSNAGLQYLSQQVSLSTPTISATGSYAVVYDLGGTSLYALAGRQISYSQTANGTILNARMNANGYLTLITKETGYKGVVTVYDSKYRAKLQVSISSSHVLDALVSDDGKTLAVVTIGVLEHSVASTITFYDVSTGEAQEGGSYDVSGIALDLMWDGDGLLLQMDDGLRYVTPGKGTTGIYMDSDRYLRGYAFGDDDYHVIIWSTYQTGYQGAMELVSNAGVVLDSVSISQEVYSISTAGRYIALLFTNQLVIYSYSESTGLTEYATLTDTAGARQAIMRSDGSAMLLGTDSATLYVP